MGKIAAMTIADSGGCRWPGGANGDQVRSAPRGRAVAGVLVRSRIRLDPRTPSSGSFEPTSGIARTWLSTPRSRSAPTSRKGDSPLRARRLARPPPGLRRGFPGRIIIPRERWRIGHEHARRIGDHRHYLRVVSSAVSRRRVRERDLSGGIGDQQAVDAIAAKGHVGVELTFATAHHQPTPATIAGAEAQVGDVSPSQAQEVHEFMLKARAADDQGDTPSCEAALAAAKKILGM